MPVAYLLRLTDAHHTLALLAQQVLRASGGSALGVVYGRTISLVPDLPDVLSGNHWCCCWEWALNARKSDDHWYPRFGSETIV